MLRTGGYARCVYRSCTLTLGCECRVRPPGHTTLALRDDSLTSTQCCIACFRGPAVTVQPCDNLILELRLPTFECDHHFYSPRRQVTGDHRLHRSAEIEEANWPVRRGLSKRSLSSKTVQKPPTAGSPPNPTSTFADLILHVVHTTPTPIYSLTMPAFDTTTAASNTRPKPAFHLASSSSSSSSRQPLPTTETSSPSDASDNDDDAPLPFPTALSRHDFLAPSFSASAYLSSLFGSDDTATRHQTLEDLRAELRERSGAISAELLELVNANYTSFLGLGDELKGGGDRVEDVRVGLLGYRRLVEEVRSGVGARREEVGKLGGELRGVRGGVEVGRRMVELDERVEVLLGRLEDNEEDEDSEEDEEVGEGDDVTFTGSSPASLTELATEYRRVERLADALGRDLPYVRKMEERIARCRNTLLLDLGTSMKEARKAGDKGHERVIGLLGVYRLLGANAEGVKILKEK